MEVIKSSGVEERILKIALRYDHLSVSGRECTTSERPISMRSTIAVMETVLEARAMGGIGGEIDCRGEVASVKRRCWPTSPDRQVQLKRPWGARRRGGQDDSRWSSRGQQRDWLEEKLLPSAVAEDHAAERLHCSRLGREQ